MRAGSLAIVPPADVDRVLEAMWGNPHGTGAAVIGRVVAEHPGMVVARTGLGATRVVDLPVGSSCQDLLIGRPLALP